MIKAYSTTINASSLDLHKIWDKPLSSEPRRKHFFTEEEISPTVTFKLNFHELQLKGIRFSATPTFEFGSQSEFFHSNPPSKIISKNEISQILYSDLLPEDRFRTRLEASCDGYNWVVLKDNLKDNLKHLNEHNYAEIPSNRNSKRFYKFFRIIRKNLASIKKTSLRITNLELFGKVQEVESLKYKIFSPISNFDENGILYYFGTIGKKRKWKNPLEMGKIKVNASGISKDSEIQLITGRSLGRFATTPQLDSWISIDFGDNVSVKPSHYTLRHYNTYDTEIIRNWKFQGSNDGKEWIDLMIHTEDNSLKGKGESKTWELSQQQRFFSKFRILQTGYNSNKHRYLALSGVELYGTLKYSNGFFEEQELLSIEKKEVKDFGKDGLIYYLGTKGLQCEWKNPVDLGVVQINQSSLGEESLPFKAVCGREVVRCVTEAREKQWLSLHFPQCQIKLRKYSLRHYSSFSNESLRSWLLEGSNDNKNWTVIKKHDNDNSLYGKGDTKTWTVRSYQYFSYFRIFQTGENSNKHYFLACSGIEFYGLVKFNNYDEFHSIEKMESLTSKLYTKSLEAFKFVPKITKASSIAYSKRSNASKTEWNEKSFKKKLFPDIPRQNWDPVRHSQLLHFDDTQLSVIKNGYEDTWQIALSGKSFYKGKMECEIEILNEGGSVNLWRTIIGLVPENFDYDKWQSIGKGMDWGYIGSNGKKIHLDMVEKYGESYKCGDIIGIKADFTENTISFSKNKVDQGIAFRDLLGEVRVAICFTGFLSSARLKYSSG